MLHTEKCVLHYYVRFLQIQSQMYGLHCSFYSQFSNFILRISVVCAHICVYMGVLVCILEAYISSKGRLQFIKLCFMHEEGEYMYCRIHVRCFYILLYRHMHTKRSAHRHTHMHKHMHANTNACTQTHTSTLQN